MLRLEDVDGLSSDLTGADDRTDAAGHPMVRRLAAKDDLARLTLGTDTPGGTGVIPRGMLRNILFLSGVCELPVEVAICIATGNTARDHSWSSASSRGRRKLLRRNQDP